VTTDCGDGTSVITDEDVRLEWQRRAERAGPARVMRASQPAELNAAVTERTRQVLAELFEQAAQALGRPLRSALEAGCGVGRLTPVIAAEADRVVALDMTAPMLDAARAACRGLSNVEFRQGRIEDVPLGRRVRRSGECVGTDARARRGRTAGGLPRAGRVEPVPGADRVRPRAPAGQPLVQAGGHWRSTWH
jgi:SAM-dependent methyltransferase